MGAYLTQFRLWVYGAIAACVAVVVLVLKGKEAAAKLDAERARRESSERSARAAAKQVDQVREVHMAAEAARTEGAKNVEESVTKAKSGDRSHFNSGW